MRKLFLPAGLLLGTINLAVSTAHGQQIVHALTGKVTAINPATKSIKVSTEDGSEGLFYFLTKPDTPLSFQKNIKAESVPAATFNKTGDQVVVYYIGDDAIRTVVALSDLGTGPFVKSTGTLVRLDKHAHELVLKNASGAEETFHMDSKTIGEAMNGAIEGEKFEADKGSKIHVVAMNDNGSERALFVREVAF